MITQIKKQITQIARIAVLCFLGGVLFAQAGAEAAFSLSVTPRRGGQNIRFEASEAGALLQNEEVTLSVTSDLGVQYQITQTVYQPLTNEMGDTIPQGSFIAFSPSSVLGTLKTQNETPVGMGQVPIYTSNAAGSTDSFILVFNVRVPEGQSGGVYHTRITFSAEPVNAATGVSPVIKTLDVRLEIRPAFSVKIQSSKGGRILDLGPITRERPVASEALTIEITSNTGAPYRILQELSEPLISQEGKVLDESKFTLAGTHTGKGVLNLSSQKTVVSQSPTALYTSTDRGAGDILQIEYFVDPGLTQKAGTYSGTLRFSVESNSSYASSKFFTVPVRVEVVPIFYLDVEMEEGVGLYFGPIRPGQETRERKVTLTVNSNLGQPYQVSQIVSRNLTNPEGVVIPQEDFTYSAVAPETGNLTVSSASQVKEGESAIFISDNKGSPEKIALNYSLALPADQSAGSYSSEIKYSATTL